MKYSWSFWIFVIFLNVQSLLIIEISFPLWASYLQYKRNYSNTDFNVLGLSMLVKTAAVIKLWISCILIALYGWELSTVLGGIWKFIFAIWFGKAMAESFNLEIFRGMNRDCLEDSRLSFIIRKLFQRLYCFLPPL